MKIKTTLIAVIAMHIMLALPAHTHATEKVAGKSASLATSISYEDVSEEYIKVAAIKKVLSRYDSPMIGEAENFVIVAQAMDLEPYLLPAITGVESRFGNVLIPGTNNAYGWNVGRTPFPTWGDATATVGYALRHRYFDKGAETLMDVGRIYAGGSTTWSGKVEHFIAQFEEEESKIRRYNVL